MSTITGTSHFVNFTKACDYYKNQGWDDVTPAELEREVREKIDNGEIALGKPDLEPGQRLLVIDAGCRYAVEEG